MSLASWFRQTAYLASLASQDSYGTPTYGAARAMPCRVELVRRLVKRATGEEAVSTHTLYTLTPVALTDRIWLPGVSTATADGARSPITVQATSDKAGVRTLYQVELG